LKLGTKMSLLTAILVATAAGVAWVGVTRLGTLNATVQDMVNRTLRKVNLASQVRAEMLLAVRHQKNAIMAPDDKNSIEFAKASSTIVANVELILQNLQKLSTVDKNDEESAALADLNDKLRRFISTNQQCLDLAVLNTNIKATALCWAELKTAIDQILALTDKVMSDTEKGRPPGDLNDASESDAAGRR
jgi:methyl-accepting chemotaxis protein